MPDTAPTNPLLSCAYESPLELLGNDYYDVVPAAEFPAHLLRFRNDALLPVLGLDPATVQDQHFIEAFGHFQKAPRPFLALRYHGYQFGVYNPALGDGRGFLYGQVRGTDGELYDFGTKGSGTTPYSRGGDGRLTLKGGVREVLAAEALHRMGVRTSRCLSLIETGEQLWRGDEPSPTRSSVMVRMQRSHIRFGTFERLHHLDRKDLIVILLDHAIEQYYPHLQTDRNRYALFYAELVERVAELAAQWMAAGFCHAVLNTDNMSITGESFDYGPYAFLPVYDPSFTAAYFDYFGRYSYANQPGACRWNLEMLQAPLSRVISPMDLDRGMEQFGPVYDRTYRQRMLYKLGFGELTDPIADELLALTIRFLQASQVSYHRFFAELRQQFSPQWRDAVEQIWPAVQILDDDLKLIWEEWKIHYFNLLLSLPESELAAIPTRLQANNPLTVPVRPEIEAVWEQITTTDDWAGFDDLLDRIRA
ncbi:MAG: YdiU family protein [Leptolyngbyaceae cyanobacterium bins.349]|nr:YdiU family protein [Leptolyngbyaceae cyanobacterium bins.349]